MWPARIENVLRDAMGLDVASIGSSNVQRAVQTRCTACGIESLREYWQRLRTSADELQELIESVIVPETWFFRDREAFTELARIAHEEWRQARTAGTVRLLSLPCSTGEEPYSMAMALLDAGYTAERFAIDGVDISKRSLAQARHAIYGKNAFRGSDLGFRDRYFENTEHGYRLQEAVRTSVRFRHANMRTHDFLGDVEPYDAIFCRNLLIYFSKEIQEGSIAVLRRLLSPTGVLFVGPAEANLFLHADFVSARVPLAFAFRKSQRAAVPILQATRARAPRSKDVGCAAPRAVQASKQAPSKTRAATRAATPAATPAVVAPIGAIDRAFALADQGRLAEAAALCESELREHGPSAPVYYLMGLISSADGFLPAANRYYRKALYLEPNHHEALVHLALLLEQQGDDAEARILRRRARRHEG